MLFRSKLLLAGDGPDRKKLELYVKEMHIEDVEFLGYVEEDQKKMLLNQARVFCSPAIYGESFGIVLLEAMASGVPIVAGNNSGYTSVMQGRGVLSLVDPEDTQVFANKLELFYADNDLRALWSEWSTEYVKQFSYDAVGEKYLDLYKNQLKIRSL